MKYVYFISYTIYFSDDDGVYNDEFEFPDPVTSITQLRPIEDRIEEEIDARLVSIINFQLLRTEPS